MNKLSPTFDWLDKIYLITDKKIIKNIKEPYDYDSGRYSSRIFNNDNSNTEEYETTKYLWKYSDRALGCHKSCYELLQKKLNYNLEISHIENLISKESLLPDYGKEVNKYINHQDFPWTAMILDLDKFINFENLLYSNKKLKINYDHINFLSDPLKNKKTKKEF